MIAPVVAAGAEPLFYPLDAMGFPAMSFLEQQAHRGVRALLAAHYFGVAQPMALLRAFCDRLGIALIEDCAHALFGMTDGHPVGSWGDFAIASLTKFLPVPEGGCLASNTHRLTDLRLPRRSIKDELKAMIDALEIGSRHNSFPGLNGAMNAMFSLKNTLRRRASRPRSSAITASGASAQSVTLAPTRPAHTTRLIARHASRSLVVSARRRNFLHLVDLLSNVPGLKVLYTSLPVDTVPYVFPVLVDDPEIKYHRLRMSGIPIYRWDEVWWSTPVLEGDVGLSWARRVFQLGCHQDLSLRDLEHMADEIRAVFGA